MKTTAQNLGFTILILCFFALFPTKSAKAYWVSGGTCGQTCSSAQQACDDAAVRFQRSLLGMYPIFGQGKMLGYTCDLDPEPINIGDYLTFPNCTLIHQVKDASSYSGCVAKIPPKQAGKQCGQAGNPITIVNGNKYLQASDYQSGGYESISFDRFYNSLEQYANSSSPFRQPMLGVRWRTNWDNSLEFLSTIIIYARRSDGQEIQFSKSGGVWILPGGYTDVPYRLREVGGNFELIDYSDTVETYDSTGKMISRVTKSGYTQTLSYTNNKLTSVSDSYGRSLTFTYNGNYLETVTAPDNQVYTYAYQPLNSYGPEPKILLSVTYPDATPSNPADNPKITYLYEDAGFPQAVTGIVDEKGNRLATYGYNSDGRAVLTTHAGDADRHSIVYHADGRRTVTNPLGKETIYHYSTVQNAPKVTLVEGVANGTCEAANQSYSYSSNGFLSSKLDWKGNRTNYTYNNRGLQESRTEAFGTPLVRTITTQWHPTFRLPTQITAPGKTTAFSYNASGLLLTRTETDTTANVTPYSTNGQQRIWTYTYTPQGQVHTVNGPRTNVNDVTTYDYNAQGNLIRVTNALNHQVNITQFDANGLPLALVDANNAAITLGYEPRQWLKTITIAGATTQLEYEPTGNIGKVTLPDGAFFTYGYDAAQRLTSIENNLGERIEWTLDPMGNRTSILAKNGGSTLVYTHTQAFDALGRLLRDIGAYNQTATFGYDKNDNQTSLLNARQFTTSWAFDALDRLTQMTDALSHNTSFSHNAQDELSGVTDPRNIATSYVYNGFGEAIYESSPDSGNITLHRDSAGNITQVTDARGIVANYTYDALNRILTESFPGNTAENRTYSYDNSAANQFGIGRLWKFTDDSGRGEYAYDARGNIVKNIRVISGTSYVIQYEYDLADRLTKITYPSGRIVHYNRDSFGQIQSVTTKAHNAAPLVTLASNIEYMPFGSVKGFTFGNGLIAEMSYDLDYRLTLRKVRDGSTPLLHYTYGYDAEGNIETATDHLIAARNQTFGYDALDRLVSAISGGVYGNEAYQYDAVGNMTQRNRAADSYVFTYPPTSNRLSSITKNGQATRSFGYDGAGNVIADAIAGGDTHSLVYNHAGRYKQLDKNSATDTIYKYNLLGERVLKYYPPQIEQVGGLLEAFPMLIPVYKALPEEQRKLLQIRIGGNGLESDGFGEDIPAIAGMTHYLYDLDQTLISENASNAFPVREYVYLPDAEGLMTPIAQWNSTLPGANTSTDELLYILTDHLNAPVKLVDTAKAVKWDRVRTPYDETATLSGNKQTNLRLPGQYYDLESAYHYNLFRDYNPALGRYMQSDPIGLGGGINRFSYAELNPVIKTDPKGLSTFMCRKPLDGLARLDDEGERNGPEIPGNRLFHQYLCVKDSVGRVTCGGQDMSSGWGIVGLVRGQPSKDVWPAHGKGQCHQSDDRKCVDDCVAGRINSPIRPPYSIPSSWGEHCQEWADRTLEQCQKLCDDEKKR